MVGETGMKKRATDYGLPGYFDLQARMGHTKHMGGESVTRALAEHCCIGPGKYVLNVGAGAGISATYLVEEFDCQMVGVDLLPAMVASARKRAHQKGLSHKLAFHLGDAQGLPFDDDLFDAVISESVNVFVPDKERAMREYVRVAKPGGFVGITEAIWIKQPAPEMAEMIMDAVGQPFHSPAFWETLLEGAGLVDLLVENHAMSMAGEARNQYGLLSLREYIRILFRAIGALLTDRENRNLIRYMSSSPRQYFDYLGFGLYVGRVPR